MVPGEFGHLPEYQEVTETPRGVYGPYWALVGERRRRPPQAQSELGGGASPLVRIGLGEGGRRPPFLLPLSSFPLLLLQLGKGGILLPPGVGLPPLGRAMRGSALSLLHSFIYGGGGHPIDI